MKAPLYDDLHQLSVDIANASLDENTQLLWVAYNKLKRLCELNEHSENNHPIQWEALGDFTSNHMQALSIYQKGLICSKSLALNEYSASISLAMAQRYYELENFEEASELAGVANELAKTTDNLELRKEISEFLLNIT